MPIDVVLGAFLGDEGKGRMVDALAGDYEVVCRFNGALNAAHTVLHRGRRWIMRQVPAGVFHPEVRCLLGGGMAIDVVALVAEMAALEAAGISTDQLLVSDRAHLILPYHRALTASREDNLGADFIGTTGNGVGFAYADKKARTGLRVGDLFRPAELRAKLSYQLAEKNVLLPVGFNGCQVMEPLARAADQLGARVVDTGAYLRGLLDRGACVLAEGAQGALLDNDLGTYPFVTSSNSTIGGLFSGLGVPPRFLRRTIGVTRGYATREGRGPLPTELSVADEIVFRRQTREHTLRVGWLDLPALRFSVAINGYSGLALTHMDRLSSLPEIPVCVAYRVGGERMAERPPGFDSNAPVECVLENLPGWSVDVSSARHYSDLPRTAQAFVGTVEDYLGVPIEYLSTAREGGIIQRQTG